MGLHCEIEQFAAKSLQWQTEKQLPLLYFVFVFASESHLHFPVSPTYVICFKISRSLLLNLHPSHATASCLCSAPGWHLQTISSEQCATFAVMQTRIIIFVNIIESFIFYFFVAEFQRHHRHNTLIKSPMIKSFVICICQRVVIYCIITTNIM